VQALAGLEVAHAMGVVHRDLKPSNLYCARLGDGTTRIKILDFGISKVIDGQPAEGLKAGATTSADAVLGTPRYMSPEQVASSKEVDARTDLWAIGVILYQMLTGVHPFQADGAGAILARILTVNIERVIELRAEVPPDLDAAVMRCLERDRARRHAR
jgi:serine/threonine-protein kinase